MNRILIVIFFSSSLGMAFSISGEVIPIVPLPREYKELPGKCTIFALKYIIVNESPIDKPISNVLDEIEILTKAKSANPTSKVISIHLITPSTSELVKMCRDNGVEPDSMIGNEGYYLKILSEKIFITANTPKGIFYGLQSLKQLLIAGKSGKYLHCLWIKDYPAFKYRGVMDDVSRGPIPTVEYVKYQIRRLAEMKVNMFMHYVEHVVKTKSHPEFAPANGNLTTDDYMQLTKYAKDYNVMFIGNFQSFGHFNNILQVQKYSDLGESGTLLSPVKEGSYSFLDDIYSEMVPAFDQTFFHVNCDETFDLGKEASKELVDSIGYENVYLQHVLRLRQILSEKNVRMMLWGDVLLQYPMILSKLAQDVVICTWNYDSLKSFESFIKPFAESKHDFIVSPGVVNSNRLFPDYTTTLKNIDRFCNDGFKNSAIGVLLTVWDDGGSALFANDWYGVSYSADKSWNPTAEQFDTRYNRAIHSISKSGISEIIHKISSIGALVPTYSMNDKVFWEKVFSSEKKQNRINADGWDEIKRLTSQLGKHFRSITIHRYEEDFEALKYINHLYNLLASERLELIRFADMYAEAISTKNNSVRRTRLKTLHQSAENLLDNTNVLRKEFEKVWYNENQPYSFNGIDTVYKEKINSYSQLSSNLNNAWKLSVSNSLLPKQIDIGLDIKPITGKYFLEWLTVNPFSYDNTTQALTTNFLSELGEEGKVNPLVTHEFVYANEKHRWKRIVSNEPEEIDLNKAYMNESPNLATYTYANIEADSAQTAEAEIQANCSVIVILNGKSELKLVEPNNEEVNFELPLRKGRNNLILKLVKRENDWCFSFSIKNQKVVNQKNRYKIL